MYTNLPDEVVEKIKREVKKIVDEYEIVNRIVRNDIFEILEKLCVVLRFPLDNDEEANGIHVVRCIKGEDKDFVFINTSNDIEKQVYTAAHELGHVWKIDEKVLSQITKECDSEAIINRFAAELLMPEDIFRKVFALKCSELGIKAGQVDEKQLIDIIIFLMNTFMVPYKAIIYRMEEVGIIDSDNCIKLEKCEEKYEKYLQEVAKANDYQNILKTDKQKSMSNLYNMLAQAEKKELLSNNKIKHVRQLFNYNDSVVEYDDEEPIAIQNIPEG